MHDLHDLKFPEPDDPAFTRKAREYRNNAIRFYISSGAYASQIICRNFLSGLRERNEYFEFLQKEMNIAAGLVSLTLSLANANQTILKVLTTTLASLNIGLDAYQEFRYFAVDVETFMPIVEAAQIELRDHFLEVERINDPDPMNKNKKIEVFTNLSVTLSAAINAVSKIEYQCTRSGIRGILNKSLLQAAPRFKVDRGILTAVSEEKKKEGDKPEGKKK